MLQFFEMVANIFEAIINGIKSLISMIQIGVKFLTTGISMFPPQITTIAAILIIVCLLYKVLGRENQS